MLKSARTVLIATAYSQQQISASTLSRVLAMLKIYRYAEAKVFAEANSVAGPAVWAIVDDKYL